MKKALGLVAAVIGLGAVGCEETSTVDTTCQIVGIAKVEVIKHEYHGLQPVPYVWTVELKNADNQTVGSIGGDYTWFLCEDGRKLKLDEAKFGKPSYE